MSTETVMRLECPHCLYNLFEPVRLDRPKSHVNCPACGQQFLLDAEVRAFSQLLAAAHAARHERERRLVELYGLRRRKQLPGDVLRELDGYIDELTEDLRRHA